MFDENFDFLLILNGITGKTIKENGLQEIIELDWCSYDNNIGKVVNEVNNFIKPSNVSNLDLKYLEENRIKIQDLEHGSELNEVLIKVIKLKIANNFVIVFIIVIVILCVILIFHFVIFYVFSLTSLFMKAIF